MLLYFAIGGLRPPARSLEECAEDADVPLGDTQSSATHVKAKPCHDY